MSTGEYPFLLGIRLGDISVGSSKGRARSTVRMKCGLVRPEGESSNPPAPIDTENLFKTLEEWNHHLKSHASVSQTPFA